MNQYGLDGFVYRSQIYKKHLPMKVFQVTPKRVKRVNGQVLTPEMTVTVTTAMHTSTPFYNGAKEMQRWPND